MDLTEKELIEFLRTTYDLEPDSVDAGTPLFSSALLDSINMVEVVAYLEDKTGLVVEADDLTLDNFDTVETILLFCRSRSA